MIYYNKKPIPLPDGALKDKSDGRVLFYIPNESGVPKRRTIGKLATEETMYPSELFRQKFKGLWIEYYGEGDVKNYELSIGMYGLVLGVVHKIGLYDTIHDIYGESYVNYIIDYAMFGIINRINVTQMYPEKMRSQVIFAEKVYSDSWYSKFFDEDMSENLNTQFRNQWLCHYRDLGIMEVWLCIDGSNNDCEITQCEFCAQGEAKSRSNSDIVGYMYIISSEDGRPITYYIYQGSAPDCAAFQQVALILKAANIRIKGVLLDAGFCTEEVLKTLEECGFDYIIMMHSNHNGHTEMVQKYGETFKWEPKYVCSDDGVFGTSGKVKVFETHEREGYVNTYFDGVRGSKDSQKLTKKIRMEKRRLEKGIEKGKLLTINAEMTPYLYYETTPDGKTIVSYNFDQWRNDSNAFGFFSILSSKDFGAETVLTTYRLRDASETGYSLLKSQEGFHTSRVHNCPRMLNKFAVGFVESIIRSEIMIACKSLNLDTNEIISSLDHIHLFLAPGDQYMFCRYITVKQNKLLRSFGITAAHFELLAVEVNLRISSVYENRYRAIPDTHTEKNKKAKKSKNSKEKNPKEKENENNDKKSSTENDTKEEEHVNSEEKNQNEKHEGKDTIINAKRPNGRPKGRKDSYQRKRRTKLEMQKAIAE